MIDGVGPPTTPATPSAIGATPSAIGTRLITHEDPYHLHKTLGIACLCNFLYRYMIHLPLYGTLGYETVTPFNTATIIGHLMLSSSSMIFKVLSRRLPKKPLLIYEEYRLHTIIFTLRGCIPYLLAATGINPIRPHGSFMGIMGLHLLVDWVSIIHGTPGLTTVRVANKSTRLSTILFRRGFSFYQIIAFASIIAGRDFGNMGFNTLIAIQSSTFLMTLVRKNLIRPYTHLLIYGACLVVATGYIFKVNDWRLLLVAVGVFGGRMLGISKYLLWAAAHARYHIMEDITGGIVNVIADAIIH
jgi:hypothetical protein